VPLALEEAPATVGPLRFAGAVELRATDPRFGGLSGMMVSDDLALLAVSDAGLWVQARLVVREDRLVGIAAPDLLPIRDGTGQPLPRGRLGDAEALTRAPDGRLLVAFERWHRIRAFADPASPGLYFDPPPGIETLSGNEGLETLAALADGRLLAIEEGIENGAPRRAWLGGARGWMALPYAHEPGWRPTDAAGLPDGGALVLERRFGALFGFAGRIMHLPAAALREASPGTTLAGREIARLAPPLLADNYEAIAIARRADGALWVFLATDDNFNALQRTLLLAFALDPAALR
jgi:hypothetical protein